MDNLICYISNYFNVVVAGLEIYERHISLKRQLLTAVLPFITPDEKIVVIIVAGGLGSPCIGNRYHS